MYTQPRPSSPEGVSSLPLPHEHIERSPTGAHGLLHLWGHNRHLFNGRFNYTPQPERQRAPMYATRKTRRRRKRRPRNILTL